MKQYLQKTFKDTLLTWSFLGIGIIISAILYAIMKVEGVSENTSLLVAFIILAGLVILGQAFSTASASRLRQFLGNWLLGEQKPSKQLESSLIVQQNVLLEKLSQNLNLLASSSIVGGAFEPSPEQPQSPRKTALQRSAESLSRLDNLVNGIQERLFDSLDEQRDIVFRLEQNQRKEQEIIVQFSDILAHQQESILQVIQNLTAQQKTLEQLVQHLEKRDTNREESGEKAAILSPTGRVISRVLSPPNVSIPSATEDVFYNFGTNAIGNTGYNWGSYEQALAAYDRAIGLNPNNAVDYNNKGAVLANLKRYEEALAAYDQAIRLNPNNATAYSSKGAVLYSLNRYEEALATYDQAIRLNPNNATAYMDKGAVLGVLNRYEEAQAAYDQAIRLDSDNIAAITALSRLKRYEEAKRAQEKAREHGYTN